MRSKLAYPNVAVYTSITNQYDDLIAVPQIEGVDFIAFVDDSPPTYRGWDYALNPIEPGEMTPRMRAKYPKLNPHLVLPDYDWTFWIDASHQIKSLTFVQDAMPYGEKLGWAMHEHPWRSCIYDEFDASVNLWKYAREPMKDQVDCYRRNGHPERWGLWAGGSILRNSNDPKVIEMCEAWWLECCDWSAQDQLSLPVVFRAHDFRPTEWPHHQVRANPWFVIREHPRNNE